MNIGFFNITAKLIYNWSCGTILLEFMVTFCAWRLVQRINLAVVLPWFDPSSSSITIVALPRLTLFFPLLSWWTYMSSWKPWIGHYDTLRKIYNWIMFPFMGYGIRFPFIIFIIRMILSLRYFVSYSGTSFGNQLPYFYFFNFIYWSY